MATKRVSKGDDNPTYQQQQYGPGSGNENAGNDTQVSRFDRIQELMQSLQPEPMDYEAMYSAAGDASVEQTRAAALEARKTGDYNANQFAGRSRQGLAAAMSSSSQLDQYITNRMYSQLDNLQPGWRQQNIAPAVQAQASTVAASRNYAENIFPGIQSQLADRTQSLLAGEVPDDVSALVRQSASAGSARQGIFGQAGGARTARDLGTTSLGLISQGASMAGTLGNFTSQGLSLMQTPIQSASALTNLLAAYRPGQTDVSNMATTYTGQITGIANTSPNQVLATGGSVYGANLSTAAQISTANQDMQWNGVLSGIGLYNDNVNAGLANTAGRRSQTSSLIGSGATAALAAAIYA